jgi:hypothetical protein
MSIPDSSTITCCIDVRPPCTSVREFMKQAPRWTLLQEVELLACQAHKTDCMTFAWDIALSDTSAHMLRECVQFTRNLQQHAVMCDIARCARNMSDVHRHAKKIEFVHHVFLYICRVWIGVQRWMTTHRSAAWPLRDVSVDALVQRILCAYAAWLFHISFHTHMFSAASLGQHVRFGSAYIREACKMQPERHVVHDTEEGADDTSPGTHVETPHTLSHAHMMVVLEHLLYTRLCVLCDVHTHAMRFLTARIGPVAVQVQTEDEQLTAQTMLAHVAHWLEAVQACDKLLQAVFPSCTEASSAHPHHNCTHAWWLALSMDQHVANVCMYALVFLVSERQQQNVAMATCAQFDQTAVRFVQHCMQSLQTPPVAAAEGRNCKPCVHVAMPQQLNVLLFIKCMKEYMHVTTPRLHQEIDALRTMHAANMPRVVHIQVHTALRMEFDAWCALQARQRHTLSSAHVDCVCFGLVSYEK